MKKHFLWASLALLSAVPALTSAQTQMQRKKQVAEATQCKPIAAEAHQSLKGITAEQNKRHTVSPARIAVQTPFLETFDNGLGDFTVIDANNDGKTWDFTGNESYAGNQGVAFYTYHRSNQANDWLVTPGIKMKGGTEYEISFETWCASQSDKERMEVRFGNAADAAALTSVLVDGFDVDKKYDNRITITKKFTPETDGDYYFGFHAISDPWKFYLFVDNVSIKTVTKASAPGAATELEATAAAEGQLKATLKFKAPAKDQNGAALTALDSIRVMRKNIRVALLKNPQPGELFTVTDDNAGQGNNTYTVVAYANGYEGKAATASVYVGQDVATAVDISTSRLIDNLPSLTATWEPVSTTGANGGYVDPTQVRYVIAQLIQSYNGPMALPIDTTEYAATAYDFKISPDEGEQKIADYLIAPLNVAGIGAFNYIDANTMILGKPYELPFTESVDNYRLNGTLWWYSRSSQSVALPVISEQNSVNSRYSGAIGWKSDGEGTMSFNTGKISLQGSKKPVVRYAGKGDHGSISVVAQQQGGTRTTLGKIELNGDWQTKELSLSSVKDSRYVALRFLFEDAVAGDSLFLDDIRVIDAVDNDLEVIGACSSDRVRTGEEFKYGIAVYNAGQKDAASYTLRCQVGNEKTFETTEGLLAAGDTKTFSFGFTPTVFSEKEVTVKVSVEFDGDEKPENNSWEKTLTVDVSKSSPVENLTGSVDKENSVALKWNVPSYPAEELMEDFESYTEWDADNFEPWLCYSNDESLQGGIFSDVKLPHEGENCAFILTNFETEYGAGSSYPGHSGYQYLSTFYGVDENGDITGSDKWLISPLLSGKAQTVTFYAKSDAVNGVSFVENLILSYSTTTNEPAQFVKAAEAKVETEGKWQFYSFDIPEGARYFAIERFDPNGGSLWLGLDDITYSKSCDAPLSYNVYKDMIKCANVTTPECIVPADGGKHMYSVTAVYEKSESAPVSVSITTDGIRSVDASRNVSSAYWSVDGKRLRKPLRGMNIMRDGDGKYKKVVNLR